jgi:hypothetical protein
MEFGASCKQQDYVRKYLNIDRKNSRICVLNIGHPTRKHKKKYQSFAPGMVALFVNIATECRGSRLE